jgi:hypothetical protein
MSELPRQDLHHHAGAKTVSAEHLEVLGKQAASKWSSGEQETLRAAIVEQVKTAGLSPEQVKRVCEFANTSAFLDEFKKEGAHKFVDFGSQGPANPAEVLQDLNLGTRSTVHVHGSHDYDNPPPKTASVEPHIENAFIATFSAPEVPMHLHDPFREAVDLKDKLAGAVNELGAEIDLLELQYADTADQLYRQVKEAAMDGNSLGEVLSAWATVAPSADFAKVAFQLFTPRLLREGVFPSADDVVGSMSKTAASIAIVNPEHPLVRVFEEYCGTLSKLATARSTKEEMKGELGILINFFKHAGAGGVAGKALKGAWQGSKAISQAAGQHAGEFVGELTGSPIAGSVTEGALSHAPHIAALLAANEARMKMNQSPTYHSVMGVIPGTADYNYRRGY